MLYLFMGELVMGSMELLLIYGICTEYTYFKVLGTENPFTIDLCQAVPCETHFGNHCRSLKDEVAFRIFIQISRLGLITFVSRKVQQILLLYYYQSSENTLWTPLRAQPREL